MDAKVKAGDERPALKVRQLHHVTSIKRSQDEGHDEMGYRSSRAKAMI